MAGSLEGISVNVTFEIQGFFESTIPITYNSVVVGPGNELSVPISYRILSDTDGDGDLEPVQGENGLLQGIVTVDISGNQVFAQFEGTAQPAGFKIKIAGLSPEGVAPGTIVENGEMSGVNTINNPVYNATTKELTLDWFFNGFQPGTVVTQTVFYDNQLDDAPQAVDDAYAVTAGGAWTSKNVLTNDIDLDNGGPLGVVDANMVTAINGSSSGIGNWVDLAGGGQAQLGANGTLQFRDDGDFKDLNAGQTRTTSFEYTVTDSTSLSDTGTVTITVTGVNDAPTAINVTNQVALAENTAARTKVADLTVVDPDTSGNNNVLSVNDSRFEIDGGSLYLKAGQTIDFEAEPSIGLTVTATDGSLSTSQAVSVSVTDVNEAPTAVLLTASSGGTIAENIPVGGGQKVADIDVTDDQLGTNTLALTGSDAASFEIRGTELFFVGASPDFETKSTYSVSVTVDDPTIGSAVELTSSPFVLTVLDADEIPPPPAAFALASDTGASASDGITQNGTINVSQIEPGATWSYSTDSGLTYTAGTGTSFTLASGTYIAGSVVVRQQDAAGNTSTSSSSGAITVDATKPIFASAAVSGATLVLTYGETLDATNVPTPSAFAVDVAGGAVSVSSVVVDAVAKTVSLTLGSAVANGQAVTVAYTDPTNGDDTSAIQDIAGNDALTFAALSVANNTPVPPSPPVDNPVTSTPNPDGSTNISLTQPQTPEQLAQFATPGVDNVSSPFSVTLPDGIENVTLTGNGNINATGNNGANAITGNAGSNILAGDAPPFSAGMSAASGIASNRAVAAFGSDTIAGSEGDDSINGNQGADDLNGNQGDDLVRGGRGDDVVQGGRDNDQVFGDNGQDWVNGNKGADTVNGGMGDDTVHGGQDDDEVRGGQGDDFVFGDLGNDQVWGDLGNDTLSGGGGADTFRFAASSGNDIIVDFNQSEGDRLDLQGQTFTVSEVNGSTVFDLSGGGTIVLQGVSPASLGDFLIA
ncbi:SwmB domain-containing protein [Aureimonas phyllosphaerae]|uniref:SwmB domain-containing protein n=1 Tax=Aureimonas phyllosphaerae TaxID=1166078 RepID=UPI003A5BCEA7